VYLDKRLFTKASLGVCRRSTCGPKDRDNDDAIVSLLNSTGREMDEGRRIRNAFGAKGNHLALSLFFSASVHSASAAGPVSDAPTPVAGSTHPAIWCGGCSL